MSLRAASVQRWGLRLAGATLGVLLLAPLIALFTTISAAEFVHGLRHPLVWPALRLSLLTTSVSLTVVLGLGAPLAWLLAQSTGRGVRAVEGLLKLPIVIPPAVAGVALLLTFGRRGALSQWLTGGQWSLGFSTAAVVMAEVFVSAPFFVQAATAAFRRIDPQLLLVARSLGASPWRVFAGVAVPLAWPGLLAGAALSWSRALGEFGATLMFAGNLQGTTQTLPLAIYTAMESDLRVAQALSMLLVLVAVVLFAGVQWLLAARATLGHVAGASERLP